MANIETTKEKQKQTIRSHYLPQETDEYNTKPSGDRIEFNDDDFKERISDLVNSNVLLLGVKPKCPRCGYRIWYQIDAVTQRIPCKGCNYEFSLPAEESWFYRLNSLIRAAVTLHGTVPLLLVLGQMATFDSRTSFITIPCVDLLNRAEQEKNKFVIENEVDFVCVKDGKFVIGEIKQSVGLFGLQDFERMLKLAGLVRPDNIIFSSMDREPNMFVKENIKKLQEDLNDKVAVFSLGFFDFGDFLFNVEFVVFCFEGFVEYVAERNVVKPDVVSSPI